MIHSDREWQAKRLSGGIPQAICFDVCWFCVFSWINIYWYRQIILDIPQPHVKMGLFENRVPSKSSVLSFRIEWL